MGETVQYKNLKGPELVSGPLNVDNHHLLVIVYYFILKESSPIGKPFSFWWIFDIFLPEFVYKFLLHLYHPPICNKYSMEQMGREVKQTGSGDKDHALSLSFCIIPPEKPVRVYDTAQERVFLFCSLDIAEGHNPW